MRVSLVAWALMVTLPSFGHAEDRSAMAYGRLKAAAATITSPHMRAQTLDALSVDPCAYHRAHLSAHDKMFILKQLRTAGFIPDPAFVSDAEAQMTGVFPKLTRDPSACPGLAQPFISAPGGNGGSHHDWPGGLVDHEDANLRIGRDLAATYEAQSGVPVDMDTLTAAIIWHDWGKALVLTWRGDGTLTPEYYIAGTGAHHILGLAEAMARGLPANMIIAQACAHTAPVGGDAQSVANWLKAAAIIARVDTVPLAADVPSRECLISHAADDNWVHAEVAVQLSDAVLARLAPRYGFDPQDQRVYLTRFRHVVLTAIGADRLYGLWQTEGDDGVVRAINDLKLVAHTDDKPPS
ncbi:hypothetical protein Q1W73_12860 [Asticcacaulis sp. ZE23SCel15]|uniref:hypothetical protein n=1 Tax=Asticcacaulis sp. ZE23SCel15 TaxID=3059027 RepID=UPI00265EE291|nr:hypothetical protein [Asticcacaulis sp. ZE23SCel15]WKL56568.1 hypothetical protein Q1W73_12860 [Asticcacaulis sp. ZE23SCel15]